MRTPRASNTDDQAIAVYFLLLPGFILTELALLADALRLCNQSGNHFSLHYISPCSAPASSLGMSIAASPLPEQLPATSWLVLPGLVDSRNDMLRSEARQAINWLHGMAPAAAMLITVCSGAMLAGAAGLLDGLRCTTHHTLTAQLQALAPRARVEENRVFVIDGKLASSAGITTGWI
ncbi:DJ-1/PfpI family protein [Chitinimonas sp.]|uniref:DJ-1/PfpI family protein n=1 Tax=Chitinimonas sp. TaxID=1934313 RepID=UPI0035AEEAE3